MKRQRNSSTVAVDGTEPDMATADGAKSLEENIEIAIHSTRSMGVLKAPCYMSFRRAGDMLGWRPRVSAGGWIDAS